MRVQVFQHVPFEGLGSIEPWLVKRGYAAGWTRFFADEAPPSIDDFDFLIALGGPMSVNDEAALPWLRAEKECIKAAVLAGKSVLGICLGAQLIASAFGAAVYPNPQKEIGWFPIESDKPEAGYFSFPHRLTVFHWHGETFDLPPGARNLAGSPACANQAFQLGRHAIGLQCHLETTTAAAHALIAHCGEEMTPGPFVQNADELQAATAKRCRAANMLMDEILAYLAAEE